MADSDRSRSESQGVSATVGSLCQGRCQFQTLVSLTVHVCTPTRPQAFGSQTLHPLHPSISAQCQASPRRLGNDDLGLFCSCEKPNKHVEAITLHKCQLTLLLFRSCQLALSGKYLVLLKKSLCNINQKASSTSPFQKGSSFGWQRLGSVQRRHRPGPHSGNGPAAHLLPSRGHSLAGLVPCSALQSAAAPSTNPAALPLLHGHLRTNSPTPSRGAT